MSRATSSSPETGDLPPGVRALDALAAQLLAAVPDLRVVPVAAGPERDALFRLRHRHVVKRGWGDAADLDGGRERDAYDDDAVQVGAYYGDALVGTVRIV